MKKGTRKTLNDRMRAEYDFSHGVRGKHYQAMQTGYTVRIHQPDGSTVVKHYKPADGTIVLAPDVRKYFPNSDAVNNTLRSLITLLPNKQSTAVRKTRNISTVRRLNAKRG
jgi:hypothetical protein